MTILYYVNVPKRYYKYNIHMHTEIIYIHTEILKISKYLSPPILNIELVCK